MTLPMVDNMEPITVSLDSGFFSEATARGAKNRWKDGDRVRFKDGLPQKMGGWVSQTISNTLMPTPSFQGVDRRELEWTALDNSKWLAQATSKKLYLVGNNVRYDITPVRYTASLTDPFTTVNGSPLVTVANTAHGASQGDFVRFSNATAVGGLTISGEYTITTVNDGNSYVITAAGNAGSNATGGGNVVAEYDVSIGFDSATRARGWGTCGYGQGTFGTRRSATCSGITLPLRTWSLDNWGEDLLACPRGGGIYWWDKTTGPLTRAKILPDAPSTNEFMLVSDSGDQVICLGAYDSINGTSDRMLIRTSDIGSLTVFVINDSVNNLQGNSVFEERLSTGSRIINGVRTRNGILIHTDKAQYLMQPDPTDIFRVGKLAEGSTILGPNAAIEVDGTWYGMARNRFEAFDGVFQELACPIWGKLFDNADIPADGSAGDPYFASVVALLHGDGTNGTFVFTDSSSYANVWARAFGTATIDTSQKKFGTASMNFHANDFIRASMNASLQLTANTAYTIEGWFYGNTFNGGGNGLPLVLSAYPSTFQMLNIGVNSTGKISFATTNSTNSTPIALTGTTTVTAATWHHFAAVRSGNNFYIFLDGVLEASGTAAMVYDSNSNFLDFGSNQPSGVYLDGFMDDIRFTNGVARYTANFTVPTAAGANVAAAYGLNNAQADKVYCWYNKDFSEIWWHYPSASSTENDRYVILNVREKLFYYGSMVRSAGSSGGTAYSTPFATAPDGTLYLHETGTSDNGVAMGDYIESFDIEIGTGKDAMHIGNFVPDMKRIAGTLQLLIRAKNRPQQATYLLYGPYAFTGTSTLVGVRAAGRQVAVRISSTGVSSDWRMGDHTFYVQPDAGER